MPLMLGAELRGGHADVTAENAAENLPQIRKLLLAGRNAEAEAMVETAISELGGLDYLFNNAGTPVTSQPIPPSERARP